MAKLRITHFTVKDQSSEIGTENMKITEDICRIVTVLHISQGMNQESAKQFCFGVFSDIVNIRTDHVSASAMDRQYNTDCAFMQMGYCSYVLFLCGFVLHLTLRSTGKAV
jgi:hypothetical protein